MLVVTRKPGEAITIGDDIIVIVVDIRGDSVSFEITAPTAVSVETSDRVASGQIVRIAEEIEVLVVSIRGRKARIGINAPRSVLVRRAEIPDPATISPQLSRTVLQVNGPVIT